MTLLLTDTLALARNQARAQRAPVLFVREEVQADLQDRIASVKRDFQAIAIVTAFPSLWHNTPAHIIPPSDILPLAAEAHDLVILDLTLHWANDPVGQLIQARRALKPDGLLLAPLFGGQTLHELRAVLAESEAALSGGLRPRVLPMAEIRDLGALLQRAGFALPVADTFSLTASYDTLFALAADLRGMGETNALAARPRHFTRKALFVDAAHRYGAAFPAQNARIKATFEIICLTGWAPAANQPRPLRPGSASHSLADVLASLAVTPRQSSMTAVDAAPKPNN